MKEHINIFSKGINADVSKVSEALKESYVHANNLRVISELGQSTFSVENIKGNVLSTTFDGVSNVVWISTVNAVDLLTTATTFTVSIDIDGVLYSITLDTSDTLWPILPFSLPKDLYTWLALVINTGIAESTIKAFVDAEGLYITYTAGIATVSVNMTSNADWTYGASTDPSNPDVTYRDYSPVTTGLKIIGSTYIRDTIVIFTTDSNSDTPASLGQIWALDIDNVTLLGTKTLIYNDYLNLSSAHPIQAVGRYETSTIQKVYWTDNYNYIRGLNIVDPNAFVYRPGMLNLFPATSFTPAILKSVSGGGAVDIGVYQLGYRLTRNTGTSTTIALLSNIVPIYRRDESWSSYADIIGEDAATPSVPTGKRITWQVENIDSSFNYIQPIVVKRTSYTGTATILLLDSIPITANGTVTIDYSGLENKEEISLEEFLLLSNNFFDTCKTLTTSNNMMLAGNIRSSKRFEGAFDARAYRFRPDGTSYITPNLSDTDYWGIAEDEDVTNPDSIEQSTFLDYHYDPVKYKYQSDGVTLGGEGPNISYTFVTKSLLEDKNRLPAVVQNFTDPKTLLNSVESINGVDYELVQALPNHKSEYISGLYRGYKRGETYRFGFMPYDKRGNPGYVKWIGDIRFPRVGENIGDPGAIYGADALANSVAVPNFELVAYNTTTHETYTNQLGIEFTVNIPPALADQISGYSIVRVKRELKDRTVIANGYIGAVADRGTFNAHPGYGGNPLSQNPSDLTTTSAPSYEHAAVRDLVTYYSPEYLFTRNTDIVPSTALATDYLYTDNYLAQIGTHYDRNPGLDQYFLSNKLYYTFRTVNGTGFRNLAPFNRLVGRSYYNPISTILNVSRNTDVNQNGPAYYYYSGARPFYNEAQAAAPARNTIGEGGRCNLIGLAVPEAGAVPMIFYQTQSALTDTNLASTGNWAKYNADVCRYLSDQYGGYGYEARSINDYISCGHYQPVTYSATIQAYTSTVYGGDTFVNIWSNNKIIAHDNSGTGWITSSSPGALSWSPHLPVESYINTHLRSDQCDNRDPHTPSTGPEERFLYNSVYSAENDVIKYFPKPSTTIFNEIEEFDTRIYISDVKVSGEITDSWSIFKQSSYIDLDGAYGPLNNLVPYASTVMTFQDSAVGALSIAPKYMLKDAIGIEEAILGVGKPLEGYSYLSTGVGCKHQWGITKGVYAGIESIYFYDALRRSCYKLTGNQIIPLTGLDSFSRSSLRGELLNYDNPLLAYGVTATYDTSYNEAWFTFKTASIQYKYEGTNNPAAEGFLASYTLSYSEPIKAFNSFYSFTPIIYVNGLDKILSTQDGSNLYLHHYGDYCNFYGTVAPSSIKFIANPESRLRKALYSIGYIGEVLDEDGYNIGDETWTRVRVTTDYQNTDWVDLTSNATRTERMWSINALRDVILNSNGNIYDPANFITTLPSTDLRVLYPERLRDFYFTIELEYDNQANRKLILPFVRTIYNPSAR